VGTRKGAAALGVRERGDIYLKSKALLSSSVGKVAMPLYL
jgi:hypothetical protein